MTTLLLFIINDKYVQEAVPVPASTKKNTIKLRTIDFNGHIGNDIWNDINAIT